MTPSGARRSLSSLRQQQHNQTSVHLSDRCQCHTDTAASTLSHQQCHINAVTWLLSHTLLSHSGQVNMRADSLDRDAEWSKTQRIAKLPRYLCVQFMRFFWKATPDSADHTGVKCKVRNAFNAAHMFQEREVCESAQLNFASSGRQRLTVRTTPVSSARCVGLLQHFLCTSGIVLRNTSGQ